MKAGNVLTVRGVKIRTVTPRISLVARYTTAPRDPIVRLVFDEHGKVINADPPPEIKQITRSLAPAPSRI